MNIFTAIGTVAAYKQYQQAKSEYEALKEQQDGIDAAIAIYNSNRLDGLLEDIDTNENDYIPGVKVSSILRVGNLVGKVFQAQPSIVLSNTSTNRYYIYSAAAKCEIYDVLVEFQKINWNNYTAIKQSDAILVGRFLDPGETIEIQLPGGITGNPYKQELIDTICAACGKKLITSCKKINIENIVKSYYQIHWTEENSNELKKAYQNEITGILRYCGEAFYAK